MSKQLGPAVFDTRVPEVYGSVTEAQRDGFLSGQKETLAESPRTTAYTPIRVQSSDPPNEYDVIPGEQLALARAGHAAGTGGEGHRAQEFGCGEGSRYRGQQTMNAMYEDHDVKTEFAHPTLSESGRQGHTYYDPVAGYSGVAGGKVPHKCSCKVCDLLVALFIIMGILLAVASLVLSGLLWFGINGSTSESECSCPVEVDELQGRVDALKGKQSQLQLELTTALEAYVSRQALNADLTHLSSDLQDIRNKLESTSMEGSTEGSTQPIPLTFPNVSVYSACEREVMVSCDLHPNNNTCNTTYVPKIKEGTYLLDMGCVIDVTDSDDSNTYITTLHDTEDGMGCRCSRVPGFRQDLIKCGLFVTRCPETLDFGTVVIG